MKRLILFLSIATFFTLSALAQSPYDNFAPEQSVKSMIEMPETQFKVVNSDSNSEIHSIEFDKNTLSLNLLNENDSVLKSIILNPNEKKFMSIDPHAEKYYHISPYAYCMNNPVRFIDPTGQDVWEINSQGEIINRIEDKTQDAFYMVAQDADGNYQRTYTIDSDGNINYNTISFKYGTIESQKTISIDSSNSYDVFKVRGDENGTNMFEFMASNTAVEWSQAKTGIEGNKGLNFITTSHEISGEAGMNNLYSGQLYSGYTVRELNHSHPGNTPYPSGSFVHSGEGIGTWGDVAFSRSITNHRQAGGLSRPLFKIYLPGRKSYIKYGPNSIRSQYGR